MSISGVQYYWFVFTGLVLGLVGGIVLGRYDSQVNEHAVFGLGVLVLMLFSGICYFAVVQEMWSLWKMKLVAAAVVAAVLTPLLHHWFSLFFVVGPLAYWLWRINGIPNVNGGA